MSCNIFFWVGKLGIISEFDLVPVFMQLSYLLPHLFLLLVGGSLLCTFGSLTANLGFNKLIHLRRQQKFINMKIH